MVRREVYYPALRREAVEHAVVCDDLDAAGERCGRDIACRGTPARAAAEAIARGAVVYQVDGVTKHCCATCVAAAVDRAAREGAA